MDHLKAERAALNCYRNFVIVHSDEEVCQWMREQQGLPPWRVGNYFVSSLLDPSILVLITLLQQVFSIYTGAEAGPSARHPSSCNQQESYHEAVFSQGDSTRDGKYPRAMLGGGKEELLLQWKVVTVYLMHLFSYRS